MLFPENIGEYLSIDEVSLSQGELYTFVTNMFISLEKYTSISFQKYTILINYDGFNFLFGGTPKKKIEGARIFSGFFIFEEFFWSLLSDRILHSYLPNGLCVLGGQLRLR